MKPPAIGAEYERPHAEDVLDRGTYILRATRTEEEAFLQDDGSVKTLRRTVCFFVHKRYPLGGEHPIPSIDCDHEKRIIHR